MSCEDCIKYKRIITPQIRPKMLSNTEHALGLEDIMEFGILPNLPKSAECQKIVTIIALF